MFKESFNRLMKEKKLNALQVSHATGIPKSIIYCWTKGEREPKLEQLVTLSEFFGVSIDELCGYSPKKSDKPTSEEELTVLLRAAKDVSPEAYEKIVANFKKNLDFFLEVSGGKDAN